ncbi:MAG: acyltransferase [Prevotella sp.]|jgi:peptidoglycan/LPS O-acetylase OafA/YrhL|nr:acyltransferase [Prevotella sp.]
METKKYEYIDSLRGIAILLVILVHVSFIDGITPAMSYFNETVLLFIKNGHLGVNLFFVVSAFTLMLSHQKRQYETHANRNFFIRRFFRIAPMYYLAIVYFTFAYYTGLDFTHLNWDNVPKKELLTNVLFINGFFPEYIHRYVPGGWSITVEFTFYAVFPFLFSKIKNINTAFIFTLTTLLISTAANLILSGTSADHNNFLELYIVAQLPVFSLGMLAFFIVTNKDKFAEVKLSSLAYLAVTVLIYCYVAINYDFIYSVVFFLLLILLTRKAYPLLSNKILAEIGKVSFSLYLMHFVTMTFFNRYGWMTWVKIDGMLSASLYFIFAYFCIFSVSYICSVITHKFIEVPGQNLGKRLIKKLERQK